jgi:two-component system cell cycle sensor histidine kinase/response regulator CckA
MHRKPSLAAFTRKMAVPGVIRRIFRFGSLVLVLTSLLLTCGFTAPAWVQNDEQHPALPFKSVRPSVLVLHSYHQGFTWTDNISKGLRAAFADFADRIELNVEYMDTRRIYSETYFEELKDLYRLKYGAKQIDVIICSDDQALHFVLGLGKDLFSGIPVVFCSVSDFDPSMREGRQLTGLLESIDIKSTLDMALSLQPGTEEVAVITDMTRTGRALKAKAQKIFNQYTNRLRFIYLEDLTIDDLQRQVETLSDRTIIFLFIFSRDKTGKVFSHEYNLKKLYQHAGVPIYSVWKFYLGHGIVGGRLTSGEAEGLMAGKMALRILRGEKASDIPLETSPTQYMFDYRQLERFHLDEAGLPLGSLITHQPYSVYRAYRHLIWSVAVVIALLLALVAFLVGNIGRRRQVEAALRQSEEKFFKLFDTSPIWMVLATVAEGRYIEANRAFYQMTGYRSEEVLGRRTTEFGLWVDPAERPAVIKRLVDSGRLDSFPIQFRMKSGEIRDFIWSATLIEFGGELCSLSGMVDVTERNKAAHDLAESEKRFRDLAELLPETIFEIDGDGNLLFANRQAFDQFLYTQADFDRGLNGFDLLVPEDRQRAAEDTAKIMAGKNLGLKEYTALRKDGSTFPVLVRSTAIYNGNKAVGLRGFMIDVSDKKRLEAQLQQSQKLESLGTLAGGVAHDFNNLLMGIQGRTSLMKADTESFHPHYEHLREVEKYVISAADLTKQLLGFARSGKYEVKPTDLNDLIAQNSQMFGRTKKEIIIHRKFQSNLATVEVDQGQIDQVLLNIYVNAWQAMPEGGDLYIQTENIVLDELFVRPYGVAPGKYVKVTVTDSGIGMDSVTLKRVFDPFFTTKAKERGTGLGLASAYGIIQNHGGIITANSEKGQGASFQIYLPASDKTAVVEKSENRMAFGGTETILLVDDEEMVLGVGKGMLEKIGYRVLTNASGRQAVETYAADSGKIDMVVLDMIMPDMGGGDTYDRLKQIDPHVKVLLSSGYSIDGQATEILKRGCNGFIQKPFNLKALSRKVREILDL